MGYRRRRRRAHRGTAVARQADLDRARAKRREADEAAAHRSIDLGRFEQLVRHGVRTLAQYDALLASLGFDEAARAGMRELLSLKVADDATARRLRAEAATKPAAPGLTLEQVRRAVLLGVQTVDQFESYLLARRYTVDAQPSSSPSSAPTSTRPKLRGAAATQRPRVRKPLGCLCPPCAAPRNLGSFRSTRTARASRRRL
jgi:hypothetical protein